MIKTIRSRLRQMVHALMLLLPLAAAAQNADRPYTVEQLDQMMAQIALYPDPLLSQVLMAATYPDEFAQAVSWSKAHPDAKGDSAVKMVENQPWDPSVASLVAFPDALITLGERPDYIRNLGDAFLAQPQDVMDSVQRLRLSAQKAGNLQSNEQVNVSMQAAPPPAQTSSSVVVTSAAPPPQVIVIQPAQPSVIYVPAYNPAVVYGPWMYPSYPPYYYPPPPGYWWSRTIATGIAWGVGIGVTNALWGGFNWGRGSVNINVNNFNNINVNNRLNVNSGNTSWNHDSIHRGNTPYKGGDSTRQKLDKQRDVANREQFRGREASGAGNREPNRDLNRDASRDASRERAAQTMQDRGGLQDRSAVQDRAAARPAAGTIGNGQGPDRDAARQRAQNADRDAARQRAQQVDRDAARQRAQQSSRDNALRGAGDRQSRQQVDRGAASQAAAQRAHSMPARAPSGGGGMASTGVARSAEARPAAARPAAANAGAARAGVGAGGGAGRAAAGGGGGRGHGHGHGHGR